MFFKKKEKELQKPFVHRKEIHLCDEPKHKAKTVYRFQLYDGYDEWTESLRKNMREEW